jgi:hypothetical protein
MASLPFKFTVTAGPEPVTLKLHGLVVDGLVEQVPERLLGLVQVPKVEPLPGVALRVPVAPLFASVIVHVLVIVCEV